MAWDKEKKRLWSKEYRKKNKDKLRSYNKDYNKEWNINHKGYQTSYGTKLRIAVLEVLGNKCLQCGFTDIRALQIDHIDGGGYKDRKAGIKGKTLYRKVMNSFLNNEQKYQLLCANCNWIKRYTNNELKSCSHNGK